MVFNNYYNDDIDIDIVGRSESMENRSKLSQMPDDADRLTRAKQFETSIIDGPSRRCLLVQLYPTLKMRLQSLCIISRQDLLLNFIKRHLLTLAAIAFINKTNKLHV